MGYLAISTNVRRYQTHHTWHFFCFQEDIALVHCACNSPTAAAISTSFLLNHAPTLLIVPSWTHWLQDLGSHTAAWVWVVSQKDWRNQGCILAIHWYSIWVKKYDFRVSPFCQVVQKHTLSEAHVIWGGIVKCFWLLTLWVIFLPKKTSKYVHVCERCSTPKVGRFLRHSVDATILLPTIDVTDRVAWSVTASLQKRFRPIEMPFGLRTLVGQRNHVLN